MPDHFDDLAEQLHSLTHGLTDTPDVVMLAAITTLLDAASEDVRKEIAANLLRSIALATRPPPGRRYDA
jgi:hypothetical protein